MKVILLEDVKNVGRKGAVVEVAEGYGRNYLLPRALAVAATSGQMKGWQDVKAQEKAREDRELSEAKRLAGKIDGAMLKLVARAGESGKLFGSVTSMTIAEALKANLKITLDKRKIALEEPIKSLGTFPVPIKLHPQVTAILQVVVAGE
ncbi:MAG: 50S ribosomal protein L9 [Firmicutes bacterium]|nr:50S ribosomal protein L9 [Bacillota bacterium]MCL5040518.1 50S ribosomal protein L9 [Bacillota bacterium]